jgi:CHAT domain-containing protein
MANPEYLIRYHASRGNFLSQFPKYKIIQLYTHASDSSSRREPVIYFYDSALYLSELVPGIKPVTQLIVLSACETGNGTLYQGEGVFNFNRAFAALGVPSSVTNLWSIDNLSTYRITELFYKYLSRGLPLDNALQKAKLEFIKNARGENRLPYYWAAPVLVGKTDPVALDKPFAWEYLIAGIGLAGIVFFCWKKWGNTG